MEARTTRPCLDPKTGKSQRKSGVTYPLARAGLPDEELVQQPAAQFQANERGGVAHASRSAGITGSGVPVDRLD
jgi:hypothetical protein